MYPLLSLGEGLGGVGVVRSSELKMYCSIECGENIELEFVYMCCKSLMLYSTQYS